MFIEQLKKNLQKEFLKGNKLLSGFKCLIFFGVVFIHSYNFAEDMNKKIVNNYGFFNLEWYGQSDDANLLLSFSLKKTQKKIKIWNLRKMLTNDFFAQCSVKLSWDVAKSLTNHAERANTYTVKKTV